MDRLQLKIDALENSLKQQEGEKVALKQTQQQIEEALQKQAEVNNALRKDMDAAKKKLGSLNRKKSEEKAELKMPSAKEIQSALKNAGFYAGQIDGVIGAGTKEAIRKFQEANQLTPDAVVGSKTWVLLAKYLEEK
jgi:peptidoglycan hydrolase CwlO-like protein